ncbi:MAG TPA: septal ring lytic transglycosylase RlpA family lipoprotein [Nitrosomonas sp.]|nr:septal ring lytic transglycosylase RlpA family lipoprotein [Nitrosomonas sp.]
MFVGCTTPFRAPVPTTTPTKTTTIPKPSPNAPYNRAYTVRGKTYHPMRSAIGYSERGIASWYGSESGNRTAMGARFNPQGLTAAHKTLPLPTKVRVTNLHNGRSVDVIVNDRGPFKRNRVIDLSHGAAKRIGLDKQGLAEVKVEYLDTLASNP